MKDPPRYGGVRVIRLGEHVRFYAGHGSECATSIIGLTLISDGAGAPRLLDMVPDRSKTVLELAPGTEAGLVIETLAIDGFTGFQATVNERISQANAVAGLPHRRSCPELARPVPTANHAVHLRALRPLRGTEYLLRWGSLIDGWDCRTDR